jgi:DNA-binding CsgD family transcriptional regulator
MGIGAQGADAALGVVELIYGAALDPAAWPDALRALCAATSGVAAGLRFESLEPAGVRQTWMGLDPGFERAYLAHYWRDDPWAELGRALAAGQCVPSAAVVPRSRLARNGFYNELCLPYDLEDLIGGVVERSATHLTTIGIMKPVGARPFDGDDAGLLAQIMPHLRRAVGVERALGTAEQDGAISWALLERLPVGVFALDGGGRPRRWNAAADRMLGDGLAIGRDGLRATMPEANDELQCAMAAALGLTPGRADPLGVRIPRPSGLGALCATLIPLRGSEGLQASGLRGTLLVVTDPLAQAEPPVPLLVRLFGLTPAEARVAVLVGRGMAPKQAACSMGSAWNTVRCQLRKVYAKTGAAGQSELVRLLTLLGLGS